MENLDIKLKINKSSYKDYVYIFYKDDNYQFPIVVTDNLREMSNILGYPYDTLMHAVYRGSTVDFKYKVERLDIRDPEELFNYFDYLKYCKSNNLKENNFTSLELYKKFCYGECEYDK